MRQYIWTVAVLIVVCHLAEGRVIVKRDAIDPVEHEAEADDSLRDKRKVDAVYGVKNAVLGFVFNKINSFIDQKTAWINQLDQTNIAKNRAHGIEPPKDPVISLSGIISGVIGQKLQAAGPILSIVTNKLTSGSGAGSGHAAAGGGFNLGSLLTGGLGGASGGGHANAAISAGYGSPYAQ